MTTLYHPFWIRKSAHWPFTIITGKLLYHWIMWYITKDWYHNFFAKSMLSEVWIWGKLWHHQWLAKHSVSVTGSTLTTKLLNTFALMLDPPQRSSLFQTISIDKVKAMAFRSSFEEVIIICNIQRVNWRQWCFQSTWPQSRTNFASFVSWRGRSKLEKIMSTIRLQCHAEFILDGNKEGLLLRFFIIQAKLFCPRSHNAHFAKAWMVRVKHKLKMNVINYA